MVAVALSGPFLPSQLQMVGASATGRVPFREMTTAYLAGGDAGLTVAVCLTDNGAAAAAAAAPPPAKKAAKLAARQATRAAARAAARAAGLPAETEAEAAAADAAAEAADAAADAEAEAEAAVQTPPPTAVDVLPTLQALFGAPLPSDCLAAGAAAEAAFGLRCYRASRNEWHALLSQLAVSKEGGWRRMAAVRLGGGYFSESDLRELLQAAGRHRKVRWALVADERAAASGGAEGAAPPAGRKKRGRPRRSKPAEGGGAVSAVAGDGMARGVLVCCHVALGDPSALTLEPDDFVDHPLFNPRQRSAVAERAARAARSALEAAAAAAAPEVGRVDMEAAAAEAARKRAAIEAKLPPVIYPNDGPPPQRKKLFDDP
jgi:hypothetical protein